MAAKSKKRLSKIDNKFLKLEKLELKDVVCAICQSILIEPVTLPCYHYFCQHCFNGSIENNALCCPLCRLRIGSWLRTATKQKNIVNIALWNFIKSKFSREIDIKLRGEDINLPQEEPLLRLSEPGEIRSEYEAELDRLKAERLQLEHKQLHETEILIKKIHQEELEAQKQYSERLKQDEVLAKHIQKTHITKTNSTAPIFKKHSTTKPRLKPTKIDSYLSRIKETAAKVSPLLTDDNTSSDAPTPQAAPVTPSNRPSPEMVPSYGKLLKNLIDKKIKSGTSFWNKENGDQDKKEGAQSSHKGVDKLEETTVKPKNGIKSLLVSLPLPQSRIPQYPSNKIQAPENRNMRTGSVDSMQQEFCFFKPIERTSPMNASASKGLPVRVPGVRGAMAAVGGAPHRAPAPSRAQHLHELCRLRSLSLKHNLPSAFVIALDILKTHKKETPAKCAASSTSRMKKSSTHTDTLPAKRNTSNKNKQTNQVNGITKLDCETSLRRTRSMGSLKDENETTPKKAKMQDRKATSERKPYLRSDSKKSNAKKRLSSSDSISESFNNDKANLAVKNLSSPLENCDVKQILEDQLRIEKLIEQEKSDLELARKMDAELNGRRLLRRAAGKRQAALHYALRPAKKLKV